MLICVVKILSLFYSMSSNSNYTTLTAVTSSSGTSTSSSVVVEEVSYEFDMTANYERDGVILQLPPELSDFTCPDNNMLVEVVCKQEVEIVAAEECLEQEENEVIEARTAGAALIVQENNQNVVEIEEIMDEEGNEAAAALAGDVCRSDSHELSDENNGRDLTFTITGELRKRRKSTRTTKTEQKQKKKKNFSLPIVSYLRVQVPA